jgi:DNA-binding transcriptional regulator PaaX
MQENEYSSVEEWLKARRAIRIRMMWTGLGLLSNDIVSVPSALEREILRIIEVFVVMKLISQTKSYGNASQTSHFPSTIEL